jgi:hypothetical protein
MDSVGYQGSYIERLRANDLDMQVVCFVCRSQVLRWHEVFPVHL